MTSMHASSPRDERNHHNVVPSCENDLLLREMAHRCVNDLQLVVSLLALQCRHAANPETSQALADTMRRVAILADARSSLLRGVRPTLEAALLTVQDALHSQAEPRGITMTLEVAHRPAGLSTAQVMTLALVLNELATNAIKHAFEVESGGRVTLFVRRVDELTLSVGVDDDGIPFTASPDRRSSGMGLGLARRLVDSIGGLLIMPAEGSKCIEIRVPLQDIYDTKSI